MTLIAVTGGIGAGKSTLMRQFELLQQRTADADDIAHGMYEPGSPAYQAILKRWGSHLALATGQLDRKAIASIVFTQPAELQWLNDLTHPLIRAEIQKLSRHCLLFCAIPLLYEGGWEQDCDAVVAVWCPPDIQRARLAQRGWDDNEIDRRLAKQLSMDEKLSRADFAVMTNCSWDCLLSQCKGVLERITTSLCKIER